MYDTAYVRRTSTRRIELTTNASLSAFQYGVMPLLG